MNKGITLLLLVVVAAAMMLVVVSQMSTDVKQNGRIAGFETTTDTANTMVSDVTPAEGASGTTSIDSEGVTLPASSLENPVHRSNTPEGGANSLDAAAAADSISNALTSAATSSTASDSTASTPAVSASTSAPASSTPAATTPPAATASTTNKPTSAGTTSTSNKPATAASTSNKATLASAGTVQKISLHFRDKGMFLRVEADKPFGLKHFTLASPDRLVVDIQGTWKGVKAPAVPSNNLIKSVRIGRQGGADRIVLDISRKLRNQKLTMVSDNVAELFFE